MNIKSSAPITTVALAMAAAVLSSCGTDSSSAVARDRADHAASVTERATEYVGDPWEKRYRNQFWKTQHIHDSWNPCHIGENVPKALQGSGPDCWSRLPGHSGR